MKFQHDAPYLLPQTFVKKKRKKWRIIGFSQFKIIPRTFYQASTILPQYFHNGRQKVKERFISLEFVNPAFKHYK